MNRQGILDSSEPECGHEGYIAEKHVYCPDCGDAGAEMLLQARIAELEAEEQLFNKTFDAQQVIIEELRAENWRLRDALNAISHDAEDTEIVRMAVNALLGGGENG